MEYRNYLREHYREFITDRRAPFRAVQHDIESTLDREGIETKNDAVDLSLQIDDLIDLTAFEGVQCGIDFMIDLNRKDEAELAEMVQEDKEIINYIISPSSLLLSLCDFNKL